MVCNNALKNHHSQKQLNKSISTQKELISTAPKLKMHGRELLSACASGNTTLVTSLLTETNIDINATNTQGYTPLMYGCKFNTKRIVYLLLKQKNINVIFSRKF